MKVADYIADKITECGVRHVFGYQGANITYIIDAISARGGLGFIQPYHEQGAAFAANGYAQASGGLGVAVSSSGPGALNLVTGVANAYFDSIPTLFISGDVSRHQEKNNLPLRQDGFQSANIISVVEPITKYAKKISDPSYIRYCLERAVYEATNGRRGPSFLSIPHWIQRTEIQPSSMKGFLPDVANDVPGSDSLPEKVVNAVNQSRRPLLLLGGGCNTPEIKNLLSEFLKCNPFPAVASLCGLDVLPHDHSSYVGFIGDYGNRHANMAVAASDCLIVLGSRMDERQFGLQNEFLNNKVIIHVDIDPAELMPCSGNYIPLNESVTNILSRMNAVSFNEMNCEKWKIQLAKLQIKYPVLPAVKTLTVSSFLRRLSENLSSEAQIFVDVGLHQMAAAQAVSLVNKMRMFFSGGLGSMGYALPASIGGYFAKPERQTVCITGDGGLMMNLQELQTIVREKLNVKIVVINNSCLGMVRDHQHRALGGRTIGTVDGYQPCDMRKIASAFGLRFLKVSENSDLDLLAAALDYDDPTLVEAAFPEDMQPFPSGCDYPLMDESLVLAEEE